MYQKQQLQQTGSAFKPWDATKEPHIHNPPYHQIFPQQQQIYPYPYDPSYAFHLDQQYQYAAQHQFQYPNQGVPFYYMNPFCSDPSRSYLPAENMFNGDNSISRQQDIRYINQQRQQDEAAINKRQKQYHQQQEHEQQVQQSTQAQTQVQPVLSASSITSSPKIVIPKIEDPSGFHTEAELPTKQFSLNPCFPPSDSNATQITSRSNNGISSNQEDLKTQDYSDFHLKIEEIPGKTATILQSQPKKEYKQLKPSQIKEEYQQKQEAVQTSVRFKSLLTEESSSKSRIIQIILDGVERQQAIDHSLYLQLPSIMSNPDNLSHFRSLFLMNSQEKETNSSLRNQNNKNIYLDQITSPKAECTTDQKDPNSRMNELLVPYDRLIKQRIFEVQYSNPDQSYSNAYLSNNESLLPPSSVLATNIQTTFQSSTSISRISSESSSVVMQSLDLNPKKKYKIYAHLQKMCETFIRGDKKKRFKERNPQSQYMSQFHNLNRLFFYQIMSIYSYESLSCFEIDPMVSEALRAAVNYVKIHSKMRIDKSTNLGEVEEKKQDKRSKNSTESGQQMRKKIRKNNNNSEDNREQQEQRGYMEVASKDIDEDLAEYGCNLDSKVQQSLNTLNNFTQSSYKTLKVENYTHAHYNTLFLKLTPESMGQLQKHSKDIESHWLSYKIDLRKPGEIAPEKLIFVNLLKSLFYKIFVHFNNVTADTKQSHFQSVMDTFKQPTDGIAAKQEDEEVPIEELESLQLRLDYYQRVVLGIHKLKEGMFLHKF